MKNQYVQFMQAALEVRENANCKGRKVGAVIVNNDKVLVASSNGTPNGMLSCLDGGCRRCSNCHDHRLTEGYDFCMCVHAEQKAIINAARLGIPIEGSVVYSTLKPCFNCLKEMLQAGIQKVIYLHDWEYDVDEIRKEYAKILNAFPERIEKMIIDDPREDWANARIP